MSLGICDCLPVHQVNSLFSVGTPPNELSNCFVKLSGEGFRRHSGRLECIERNGGNNRLGQNRSSLKGEMF